MPSCTETLLSSTVLPLGPRIRVPLTNTSRWTVLVGVMDQGQSIDVTSFFNSLATLRVFSVAMGTRVLVFDVLQNLGEAVTLVVLLVVRVNNGVISHGGLELTADDGTQFRRRSANTDAVVMV